MKHLSNALLLSCVLWTGAIVGTAGLGLISNAHAANCVAKDNLTEIASKYIDRCRAGGIKNVFPSEFLGSTLKEIRDGSTKKHQTAWKLLSDNRFQK